MRLALENNLLSIDNYKQIMELTNDLIQVEGVRIKGQDLKVKYLDKRKIVIQGTFKGIQLGDNIYELQSDNEQK